MGMDTVGYPLIMKTWRRKASSIQEARKSGLFVELIDNYGSRRRV